MDDECSRAGGTAHAIGRPGGGAGRNDQAHRGYSAHQHKTSDLNEIGLEREPQEVVTRLAGLAGDCGLDGVVCSALEAPASGKPWAKFFAWLRLEYVTPMPSMDEQKRVSTPRQAIENGAHYLVIGRPITQAEDPVSMLLRLNDEMSGLSEQPKLAIAVSILSRDRALHSCHIFPRGPFSVPGSIACYGSRQCLRIANMICPYSHLG